MTFENFLRSIGLGKEERELIKALPLTEAEIQGLPEASYLQKNYEGDRPDVVLSRFARYLFHSEEAYHARGLTHAEWLSTMSDLAIWAAENFRVRGERGVRETGWLAHLVRTEIFRLGRLQFIPRVSEEAVSFGKYSFPAGTLYSEVHIPSGEALLPALADASFKRAKELFAPAYCSCDSWLLSPKLKTVLGKGNIAAFASRFTLAEVDGESRSAERYLLGDTPLTRAVSELSARGEAVGSALGYLVIS